MSYIDKLKTYLGSSASIRQTTEDTTDAKDYPDEFHRVLGGVPVVSPHGAHMVADNDCRITQMHGGLCLSGALDISPEIIELMAKDSIFRGFDFRRALFIDTETTGLSGGTGTLAFLIGVGYFREDRFHMRQYFLRDFDEEASALCAMVGQTADYDYLVSFNGRSFDIPLLSTRLMLNRMANPFEDMPNLDLLFSARRIFKERLKSVSLSSLESELFDLKRTGDIPGYEIPSVYFRYLRDKNPVPLRPIFYHNRIDILSMVTLAVRLAKALADPFCQGNCADEDYYCLGKIYADRGDTDKAIRCYTKALEIPAVRGRAYIELSLLYKRRGRAADAKKLWHEMDERGIEASFALVELAKYYEHLAKDYDKAMNCTQRAIELALKRKAFSADMINISDLVQLNKRRERIKRKQNKGVSVS